MECVVVIGGLVYDYFSRSTANANEFVWIKMNERGEFAGLHGLMLLYKKWYGFMDVY